MQHNETILSCWTTQITCGTMRRYSVNIGRHILSQHWTTQITCGTMRRYSVNIDNMRHNQIGRHRTLSQHWTTQMRRTCGTMRRYSVNIGRHRDEHAAQSEDTQSTLDDTDNMRHNETILSQHWTTQITCGTMRRYSVNIGRHR